MNSNVCMLFFLNVKYLSLITYEINAKNYYNAYKNYVQTLSSGEIYYIQQFIKVHFQFKKKMFENDISSL